DGAVDADRAGGERFDTARVIELITRHCPELAHGADGRALAGGRGLHGRGAGRRRPHRPRGQAVLSGYLPPSKDWIFFSASRFFCRPLTCCSISVMEEPSCPAAARGLLIPGTWGSWALACGVLAPHT